VAHDGASGALERQWAKWISGSQRIDAAEVDERWSFVGHNGHPRWLGHAIDHHTGKVLASVCGRRQDQITGCR
jgi:hypothetical protein